VEGSAAVRAGEQPAHEVSFDLFLVGIYNGHHGCLGICEEGPSRLPVKAWREGSCASGTRKPDVFPPRRPLRECYVVIAVSVGGLPAGAQRRWRSTIGQHTE
jgi:hypothetical protein